MSLAMMNPSWPYTPTQLPDVEVSKPANSADGAGGGPFNTVMGTAADFVVSPRLSIAVAVRVCGPSETVGVAHGIVYGGPVVAAGPTLAPSTRKFTEAIPCAEVAFALSDM